MLKGNAREAMSRLTALNRREMPDRILATVGTPSPRYEQLVAERGLNTEEAGPRPPLPEDLDLLFDLAEAGMADRGEVEDDSIPGASPNSQYGDYVFGALLGAPISFYGTDVHTWSWTDPLITDWAQLDDLSYDPEGEWTRKCLDNLRYGVQRAGGRYALSCLLAIEALNLCVMVRGASAAYLDVMDHPDELRRLMAFGVDFITEFTQLQRGVTREHNEQVFDDDDYAATCTNHSGISLSVDAYDLCHVDVYRRMGHEYQAELIRRCGWASYHIHGDGRHLIPEVASLPSVVRMSIQDDMHELLPRAFELRRQLRETIGEVPLYLSCSREELLAGMRDRSLPGGAMYSTTAGSVAEANEIMKQVRDYEAPADLAARAG